MGGFSSGVFRALAIFLLFIVGCGSQGDTPELVGSVEQATSGGGSPDPAGSPVAGCNRYLVRLANGNLRFAVKFPQSQAYVEVFVKRNGTQYVAQNIVSSGSVNADGSYTYSLVRPASDYHNGDIIKTRFYSYRAGRPGVFTPGPADTVFAPDFVYGQTTCNEQPSGCHTYITKQSNGDIRFAVTLPDVQQYVEVFVRQNGVQNVAQNIVASRVSNGNGTSTYSLVKPAAQFQAGDSLLTRFYSYKAGQPGVFTPGPQEGIWAPEYIVGSSCQKPEGGSCANNAECQAGLSCIVGTCRNCANGGCPGSTCSSTSACVAGLICSGGTCKTPCEASNNAPGCVAAHCGNGVKDAGESDVDCGGSCPPCAKGDTCGAQSDCGTGLTCGIANGGCFGSSRSEKVCWPAQCEDGVSANECGQPDSPCGQNCGCVVPCTFGSPTNACPSGEVCKQGVGGLFNSSSPDVCVDSRCPSNDPNLCGSATDVCGSTCVCTPNCSQATCENPSDGCGGQCPNVCDNGEAGCGIDAHCPLGSRCIDQTGAGTICLPGDCAFRPLVPPLCGSPGAHCGDECPVCTPQCGNVECGLDPVCGTQDCGSCAQGQYCSAAGTCTSNANPNQPIEVPDGNGGTRTIEDLPHAATTPAGALAGQVSVSPQGTAEYTVPIDVPPGRNGLQPDLALRYSGSKTNGQQGVGWRLEGFSTITRCPSIYALDGKSEPVKNDTTDHFCIDGQRLEVVQGAYGENGSQYRTLVESFSKIVAFKVLGDGQQWPDTPGVVKVDRSKQGPDYFEVRTKDGRIMTYGKEREATLIGRDGVRYSWLLHRVEDRSGNYMTVKYSNVLASMPQFLKDRAASFVRPHAIVYNGYGILTGGREVRFEYENRNDAQIKFLQGGLPQATFHRLQRIVTYVYDVPVKSYRLSYGESPLSQISEIRECAGNSDDLSQCKQPTKFKYRAESGFIDGAHGPGLSGAGMLDANGDGVPDFFETSVSVDGVRADPNLAAAALVTDIAMTIGTAFAPTGVGIAISVVWALSKDAFWGALAKEPTITFNQRMYLGTRDRLQYPQSIGDVQVPCSAQAPTTFFDYDQDGKDDIVRSCASGTIWVGRSLGDGHFEVPTGPVTPPGFFNAGIKIIAPGPAGGYTMEGPASVVYDVNGDSLPDVVGCKDQYNLALLLRLSPSQGFAPAIIKTYPPADISHEETQMHQTFCGEQRPTYNILDVNGDSTPELLVNDKEGWKVLRYKKDPTKTPPESIDWEPIEFPIVGGSNAGTNMNQADLNGDGLSDIAAIDGDTARIWLNTGKGFLSQVVAHPQPLFAEGYRRYKTATIDYDADGRLDFVQSLRDPGGNCGSCFATYRNFAVKPDSLLQTLTAQQALDLQFLFPSDNIRRYVPFNQAGDLDGDGNDDLFGDGNAVFYGTGAHNMLLQSVEDGLGKVTTIGYDARDAYKHTCTGNSYPEVCVKRMTGLVSSISEGFVDAPGGQIASERMTKYQFVNARVNVAGHGWLGFERRIVRDVAGNTVETTDYEPIRRYDLNGQPVTATTAPYFYPLAGLPKQIVRDDRELLFADVPTLDADKHGRRWKTTNYWYLPKSDRNRPFPFLSGRSRDEFARPAPDAIDLEDEDPIDFEVNGPNRVECSDSYTPDVYGNVVSSHTECQAEFDQQSAEETLVETTFRPETGDWLIALPETTTITNRHWDEEQVQRYKRGYDSLGRLTSLERDLPGSSSYRKTLYTPNAYGNVELIFESVATSDPSRSLSISYDVEQLFPATITNAKGHLSHVTHDVRWGTPATVVDPNGIAIQKSYDGFGRLAETRTPADITSYTVANLPFAPITTAAGELRPRFRATVERQGVDGTPGASSASEVDYQGRLVRKEATGFGGVVISSEMRYDSLGRPVRSTQPHPSNAAVIAHDTLGYDYLDRVIRIEHSDGSSRQVLYGNGVTLAPSYQHLLSGLECFRVDVTRCAVDVMIKNDEDDHRAAVVIDSFGRKLRTVDGEHILTTSKSSNFGYGAFDRLIRSRNNAGVGPDFTYDSYGRLLQHNDPDVGPYVHTYSGYDELKTRTNRRGETRTYSYDPLGRIESIVDVAGTSEWFYDDRVNGIGRLSELSSPGTAEYPDGQHIRFNYESPEPDRNRGKTKSVEYLIDGTSYTIGLEYDDLGRVRETSYPTIGGGAPIVVRSSYDLSGAVTTLQEVGSGLVKPIWQMTAAFQGYLPQAEVFGNGASTTFNYDPDRRWLDSTSTTLGGEAIQSLSYDRYDNGQVRSLDTPDATFEYTYDSVTRLSTLSTTVGVTTSTSSYSYDDSGNVRLRGNRSVDYWLMQPNLVKTAGLNSYVHDANGNVSQRSGPDIPGGTQTIEYTPFNLPKRVTTGSGGAAWEAKFDYTADEMRAARRDPDTTRYFISNLYQRVATNVGDNTVEERFRLFVGSHAVGEIVRGSAGDKTIYFHADHRGTPETISDSAGDSLHQSFEPWGEELTPAASETTRVGFTGHQHDRELGLIDMNGRVYDPLSAQFMSADPMMQAPYSSQGINRYAYVFNDPINHVDPSGYNANDVISSIVGGIVIGGHIAAAVTMYVKFGGPGIGLGLTAGNGLNWGMSAMNPSPGAASASSTSSLPSGRAAGGDAVGRLLTNERYSVRYTGRGQTGVPGPKVSSLSEEAKALLGPIFDGFVDLNKVQVEIRELGLDKNGDPIRGQYEGGDKIVIDPDTFANGRIDALGTIAHELVHVAHENLVGRAAVDTIRWHELQTSGDFIYEWSGPGPVSNAEIRATNFMSGPTLEAIARRVQNNVVDSLMYHP